jgi:hypothetical protein
MTYPALRRRRRRRVIAVVVAVGVILAAVFAVGRARSDRQVTREYLDVAMAVATGEEDAAARFVALVEDLEDLERPQLVEVLDLLETESARLATELNEAKPPEGDEVAQAHSFLAIAVGAWRDGLKAAREAMLTLSEDPLEPNAILLLDAAIEDLHVGDSAYEEFAAMVRVEGTQTLAAPYPAVRFIPQAEVEAYDAEAIARRILEAPALGVVDNVAIADIKLEPGPVGERSGIPLVPWSDTLDAEATVSNRGSELVETITVDLTLVSNEGELFEASQGIEALEPGDLVTVAFTGLPVQEGRIYELEFSLPGGDDDDTDDTVSFRFIRNARE